LASSACGSPSSAGTNGGWTEVTVNGGKPIGNVVTFPTPDECLTAASDDGKGFLTSDGGKTWRTFDGGVNWGPQALSVRGIWAVKCVGASNCFVTAISQAADVEQGTPQVDMFYASTDGGKNWAGAFPESAWVT
jgi:hypothetical protein